MNVRQLKEVIIVPTLTALGMYSPSAVNLLLGTAAQETHVGQYIVQVGIGIRGGIGIYQMEKPTYNDIWDVMIANNSALKARVKLLLGYDIRPIAERMASDLLLATVMARLHYYRVLLPLPNSDDIVGMAAFYKRWWNTLKGKATEQEFIDNYARYITKGLA